jgi:calcineurin-like phosphoesterase family protein
MRNYWFIADIHLDHPNVIHMCNRPFKNVIEMEQKIIENINRVVKADDILVLVGDVSLGKRESWVRFLSALTTKNILLVKGNHDSWKTIPKDMVLMVVEQMTIRMYNQLFVVSHYPYRCSVWRAFWKRLHPSVLSPRRPRDHGFWLLHGHDHRKTKLVDYHPRMFNVGCDANDYKPISDREIIRHIQIREKGS